MERNQKNVGRTNRLLAFGSTGMLAAVTMIMVLSPVSAAAVHPSTTLSAPYKGSVSSPNQYTSVSSCAGAKVTSPAKWSPTSGMIGMAFMSKAASCAKSLGYVGAYSSGYASAGISVALPIRVASNGAHSVAIALSTNIAAALTTAWAACPTSKVTYPPPSGSYGSSYCQVGGDYSLYLNANIVDLNNASWYGNYSYWDVYNDSGWQNSTYCYNFGTPACSNTTSTFGYSFGYHWDAAGTFVVNGASSLMLWTNGTNMVRSHHYVLELSISMGAGVWVDVYNVAGHWSASGTATFNMATLGNGAKLGSVVIT